MAGPLHGIKILDLTSVVMGPYAAHLLCDYGADVIKIEPPEGDVMRQAGPMRNEGMGHLYMTTNSGKRSVVLDLKKPKGRELLLRLAVDADILLYNIRPQAMTRLGLSYEDVAAVNPRIIYVGAIGFSQQGPYAERPAYDDLIQGMAGIPWLSMQAGALEPRYAPFIMADRIVGLQVATAMLAALHHRTSTGQGQRVDVPMFEGLASIIMGEHMAGKLHQPATGAVGYQRSIARNRRPFRTRDGYLCTLVYTNRHWRSFFELIGRPEMFKTDPRFASQSTRLENIDAVYGYLAEVLETRTTAEWVKLFVEADIPAAPMNSIDDMIADPHLNAIGFFEVCDHPTEGKIVRTAVPTDWSESKPEGAGHAPRLGEHTWDVLTGIGLSENDLNDLHEEGVIGVPKRVPARAAG